MIMIISGALGHIDTLHVDWHLLAKWQVRPFSKLSNKPRSYDPLSGVFPKNYRNVLDTDFAKSFLAGSRGSKNKRVN